MPTDKEYIIFETITPHKRYVIIDADAKHKPCACAWVEKERHTNILTAVTRVTALRAEQQNNPNLG